MDAKSSTQGSGEGCDGGEEQWKKKTATESEGGEDDQPRKKPQMVSEDDPDLDELLDLSLSEFGRHVPVDEKKQAAEGVGSTASEEGVMKEFEEIFSEDFAAEAEAQLSETMQVLAADNPELWQQFDAFAKNMGLEGFPLPESCSSQTGTSVDDSGSTGTLDSKLEETLKKLRKSTERIELGVDSGGEDSLMKVMEGMMDTLLSKDVLYPSLSDLCKQYPGWLSSHREVLSKEDYIRYTKQMDVMQAICQEFESEGDKEESQQKILQLMQQLQDYGQPPKDLTGEMGGPPTGIASMSDPKNCLVM